MYVCSRVCVCRGEADTGKQQAFHTVQLQTRRFLRENTVDTQTFVAWVWRCRGSDSERAASMVAGAPLKPMTSEVFEV